MRGENELVLQPWQRRAHEIYPVTKQLLFVISESEVTQILEVNNLASSAVIGLEVAGTTGQTLLSRISFFFSSEILRKKSIRWVVGTKRRRRSSSSHMAHL